MRCVAVGVVCSGAPRCAAVSGVVLYCLALYCIVFYCILLYSMELYGIVLC